MTALTPVWFLVPAWANVGRGRTRVRKAVTFAVESRGPLSAMRRVHALGYELVLDNATEPVQVTFEQSFEADYRLPMESGSCPWTPSAEVAGNLS